MTVVKEDPACFLIEDDGGVLFGPFDSSMAAYKWAMSNDGTGLPFTIKEVWTPSDRR